MHHAVAQHTPGKSIESDPIAGMLCMVNRNNQQAYTIHHPLGEMPFGYYTLQI
jgi:hypothetical protein